MSNFHRHLEQIEAEFPVGALPAQVYLDDNRIPLGGGWPSANDMDIRGHIAAIPHQAPTADVGRRAVGLIVGNGYIQSVAPFAPVDAFVLADQSSFVHHHFWDTSAILEERELSQYEQGLKASAHPFAKLLGRARGIHERRMEDFLRAQEHPYITWLRREQENLGDMHFTANEHTYTAAQAALRRARVISAQVDLFDETVVDTLAQDLDAAGAQLTYLNLTNIHDWHTDPPIWHELLSRLPIHPSAYIGYSALHDLTDPNIRRWPIADHVIGLEAYASATAQHNLGVQQIQKKP